MVEGLAVGSVVGRADGAGLGGGDGVDGLPVEGLAVGVSLVRAFFKSSISRWSLSTSSCMSSTSSCMSSNFPMTIDVGDTLGDSEGLTLGEMLGEPDGDTLGEVDGLPLGEMLGLALGLVLGEIDGLPDGDTDGLALGLPLGETDGDCDGLVLGDTLGLRLGKRVGSGVGHAMFCACVPWQLRMLGRERYFLPISWYTPAVLDCDDGVFCSVLHLPHPDHPFQHSLPQPGSQPWDSPHAPAG